MSWYKPIPMPVSKGRFVRIELPGDTRILSLAEVEVFSAGKNIAVKQKASASSAAHGGVPERAVDGNTDGNFANGSVTCTQEPSANPWWEVDLGRTVDVETIQVFNRSDCCGDRLNGFTLKILNGKRQVVFSKENVQAGQVIEFSQ
ncbi:MAG: discoidin domain-containing protein [Opitutales bacterium]